MPRKLLAVLAVLLGALALVGASAARTPHESTYRPIPKDVETAKSLLVTLADVPGFRDGGAPPDTDVTCSTYDPDLSALVTTGEADGRYFTHTSAGGALMIGSQAAVFRSAAEANAYWKRGFATRKIAPCVAEAFRRGLPPRATLTHVRAVPVRASSGPLKVMSWNLVGRVHQDGRVVPFVLEAVGMQRGRAISFLLAMSMGQPPVEQVRRVGAIASAKLMGASLGPALPAA
jgi:hypothetical protein